MRRYFTKIVHVWRTNFPIFLIVFCPQIGVVTIDELDSKETRSNTRVYDNVSLFGIGSLFAVQINKCVRESRDWKPISTSGDDRDFRRYVRNKERKSSPPLPEVISFEFVSRPGVDRDLPARKYLPTCLINLESKLDQRVSVSDSAEARIVYSSARGREELVYRRANLFHEPTLIVTNSNEFAEA